MDLDDAAPPSALRPSAAFDRPSRTPFGPRIRTRPKHPDNDTPTSPRSPSSPSRPLSPDLPILAALALAPAPAHADVAVQTPLSPHKPTPTFVAPPPLTPPPAITFESAPIPWKGLPLDAAQWTFSSSELQEIVSKAIRLSARESFVRLLSLQALEVDIVHEAARLDSERAAAQAKWRFEVGRRTMLMQALNSTAASSVPVGVGNGSADSDGANLVSSFVSRLATSTAACDAHLASVLDCLDQQSQLTVIQHQHWASALAVALRKLNKAYERQGHELKRLQARVRTLEDELEEAWREAEKMAIEFDELEQRGGSPDDLTGPGDAYPRQLRADTDDAGTVGDMTVSTDVAVVLGVTATAVASKATLVSPEVDTDKSDARSTRSRRSARGGPSHVSRLSAARSRSRAASNSSLRLPKALRSAPPAYSSSVDSPPVPPCPPTSTVPGQSFLDLGERLRKSVPRPRHLQPSVALPTPPPSAGPASARVPSIWLETDSGKGPRLNGLDRTHSLQIFSSLKSRTLNKTRRSNLVMSLTGSDRGSDPASPIDVIGGAAPSASGSSAGVGSEAEIGAGTGTAAAGIHSGTGTGTDSGAGTGPENASPLSTSSPVSLPTYALARGHGHCRGPSVSSSNVSVVGVGARPGSAGARLTGEGVRSPSAPRRSLVSRASSIILRRLSQATLGSRSRTMSAGSKDRLSPSRSHEALRASGSGRSLAERWREREAQGLGLGLGVAEEEGEVMLIGSPTAEALDDL